MLNAHFQHHTTERFMPVPFIPASERLACQHEDYLYSNNPDAFYAFLSVLHAAEDKRVVMELIGRKDVVADLQRSNDYLEKALYRESQFECELAQSTHRHTLLSDDEIRTEFSTRFDVLPVNMMELPTDRSIYFAKVNHGYWEYMRGAYDDAHGDRDQFRDINISLRRRRLRTSGVTQVWGRQINRHLLPDRPKPANATSFFCVSLTAGIEPPALSIRKELNPVTRGAAIGMMSMFEAALPGLGHYQVGDGGATRSLIINRKLGEFFEKFVSDADACLFVTPPHLKHVDFVNFKGAVYKFMVPPTRINETWKTVVATLLGYLSRLSENHRTITVLAQGASVASLAALLFADMDAVSKSRIRFIDLGRVLDVAIPEVLQKQAWAQRFMDNYIAEGKKMFRLVDASEFILASPI